MFFMLQLLKSYEMKMLLLLYFNVCCFSNLQLIAAFSARQSAKIELKVGHAQTRTDTHKHAQSTHRSTQCNVVLLLL